MTRTTDTGASRRLFWRFLALGTIFSASCLLTTSLDGLEGPPLSPDAGPEGGTPDGGSREDSDAVADAAEDAPVGDAAEDAPIADGASDRISDDGRTDGEIFDVTGDRDDGAPNQPIPVAPTGGIVRGIAEHGADVYWVQGDTNTGIVRAPKVGGQPAFFQMAIDAYDVAVDDDYVYWSTGPTNFVFRKPIGSTGSAGQSIFSGAGQTLYLAVGMPGRVFATGGNTVVVGPRVDAGISDAIYPFQNGAAGIALSGSDLFWSVATGILRGNEAARTPQPVYTGTNGEVAGIAADGQEIYWVATDGAVRALQLDNPVPTPPREVCRASVDMGDAALDAPADAPGTFPIVDIAVDDQWVYFAEPSRRRISKCAKR